MDEIKQIVAEVKHTMDCEGLPLTEEDEQDVLDVLQGRRTEAEVIKTFLAQNGLLLK